MMVGAAQATTLETGIRRTSTKDSVAASPGEVPIVQIELASPPITEPATPLPQDRGVPKSNSEPTPGGSEVQTPFIQTPTPIQPYFPFHATMTMPTYQPTPLAPRDPFMTGTASNPYQYTDVSHVSDPVPDTRRNRGGVSEPFPEKLHRMLEHAEREGLADVVSFFRHGRAFAIHKPKRFVSDVLPQFFKQTRLTSFQRQLNLYGFRRISQGPDSGGYYHELFLKGRPGLCVNMKRTKLKGDMKLKRDPDSEPNFYAYPPINPAGLTTIPTVQAQILPQPSPILMPAPGQQDKSPSTPAGANGYATYIHPAAAFGGFPLMPGAPPYTAAQLTTRPGAAFPPYPPYAYAGWMPGQAGTMPVGGMQAQNATTPTPQSNPEDARPAKSEINDESESAANIETV